MGSSRILYIPPIMHGHGLTLFEIIPHYCDVMQSANILSEYLKCSVGHPVVMQGENVCGPITLTLFLPLCAPNFPHNKLPPSPLPSLFSTGVKPVISPFLPIFSHSKKCNELEQQLPSSISRIWSICYRYGDFFPLINLLHYLSTLTKSADNVGDSIDKTNTMFFRGLTVSHKARRFFPSCPPWQ